MNPIRAIARFNNHLAWWWGSLMSKSLGTEQQWALSSGSRIASLMIGFNIASIVLLFQLLVAVKINLAVSMIIVGAGMIALHIFTISKELHDLDLIKSYTSERIRDIKTDSIVYIAITLAVLLASVYFCV